MAAPSLKEVVASALRIDPAEVTEDIAFGTTPAWDSLNHVTLMMALEQEFGVTITDDQIVELTDLPAIERFMATAPRSSAGTD